MTQTTEPVTALVVVSLALWLAERCPWCAHGEVAPHVARRDDCPSGCTVDHRGEHPVEGEGAMHYCDAVVVPVAERDPDQSYGPARVQRVTYTEPGEPAGEFIEVRVPTNVGCEGLTELTAHEAMALGRALMAAGERLSSTSAHHSIRPA